MFTIYQAQTDDTQKNRITEVIHQIMIKYFVNQIIERFDNALDNFVSEITFLSESLKIRDSYNILRSLIDRGSLGPGPNIFINPETEKKVLRSLMTLQPETILFESIWKRYWSIGPANFWDVVFLGIRKSNPKLAISLLNEAHSRWVENKTNFDFPQALYGLLSNNIQKELLSKISFTLSTLPSEERSDLKERLKVMGISDTELSEIFPLSEISL